MSESEANEIQGKRAHKEQQQPQHEEGGSTGPPGNVASSALVWAGLGWPGLVWPRLKTAVELSWQRTRQHGSLMAAANVICDLCFHGKCWARKLRQAKEMGGGRGSLQPGNDKALQMEQLPGLCAAHANL